jgi:hypothetical protein
MKVDKEGQVKAEKYWPWISKLNLLFRLIQLIKSAEDFD